MMKDAALILMVLVVGICAGVLFVAIKIKTSDPNKLYDVFKLEGSTLTILAGIPASYPLSEIDKVSFSKMRGRQGSYTGILRIVRRDGSKSRPFLFDASAYRKHFVFYTSKNMIELATETLMEELKRYGIRCVKDW